MAERRMFAKTIVLSDAFLDMPMTARCLYFTLGMFADDDGFVNNPKGVVRQIGASSEDIDTLITNKFLIAFDGGVVVIKHWRISNYLQKDRYCQTKYKELMDQLQLDENNAYTMPGSDTAAQSPDSMYTHNVYTQDRLGKVSIGKDSIDKDNSVPSGTKKQKFMPPSVEEVRAYIAEKGMNIDAEKFWNFYESKGWMVGKNPMKNWRAACNTWNTKDNPKPGGGKTPSFDPAEVGRRARENDPIL